MNPTKVLIADDHSLVRAGLRSLVAGISSCQVVGEAGDGLEAINQTAAHHPDVVLMDITMKGLNGIEATTRISKEFPRVRVIILSMHASEEYVIQSLRAGAAGYLLKDSVPAELELAIRSVAGGESYLSPAISKHVVDDYLRRLSSKTPETQTNRTPFEQLTPRQREILQLIAEGLSTKEIASHLNLSVKTVETHRTQLMERLDIHEVTGLVRYAIRMGVVSPEE